MQALMELIKALVKFILVAGIGYLVVSSQIGHLLALGHCYGRRWHGLTLGLFLYVLVVDGNRSD